MQMADLTQKDVLKLAALAKIHLDKSEIDSFTHELDEILLYVEQLSDVDVSGLTPTNQVTGLINVMRKDEVKDYGIPTSDLLKNLPDREDDLIKVKRVL